MTLARRGLLHLTAGAAAVSFFPIARAQTYPARPVRVVVGFAAGGPTDLFARLMAQQLSERLGQTFIVDNRPGAASNIATEAVVKASPDGYTLLTVSNANAFNATLYDKLKFDFLHDIMPVAGINRGPSVMEVHPSFPANTVPEFIAYAKANPGRINYGSGGNGSQSHLFGALFSAMSGVSLAHIPYRGAGPALADLLGGHLQVMFDSMSTSVAHITAARLRPLAVTSAARSPALPDIPSLADFVPGYDASGWNGIGAPKNTPVDVIDRLNTEINSALTDPETKTKFVSVFFGRPPGLPDIPLFLNGIALYCSQRGD
jgi:tripartite-type tricarboxylate transporter receptor subunit TctC